MALFVFLCDFGTIPTVWHHLFFDRTLELFRQCEMLFLLDIWNCSDSVASFAIQLNFGTFPRVWHYWFFIFLLDFETVPIV
jgi:hypothetical protein